MTDNIDDIRAAVDKIDKRNHVVGNIYMYGLVGLIAASIVLCICMFLGAFK